MIKPIIHPTKPNLMITKSDDTSMKLQKVGTNEIYLTSATDVILGYLPNGLPYGKYTYIEIPKTQEDLDLEQKVKEMAERQGGNN